MQYKKKVTVLSVICAALALVYILTFVFDYESGFGRGRNAAFSLLDPSLLYLMDKIEIYQGGNNAGTKTVLSRKNNIWVFSAETGDHPVKQGRVEDFLNQLTRKEPYTLRASSSEARERLGLLDDGASRIVVRGGAGLPLLDLLIGTGDALGREVYLRRTGENEIYSAEDRITVYVDSKPNSWYDLRLFPPDAAAAMVQQADITLPGSNEAYTLRRRGEGWIIPADESAALDSLRVEAWLRSVLEAEAEDFASRSPQAIEGSISLRLGDGTTRSIQTGPADEQNRRSAVVSVSALEYVLSEWTLNRLFREKEYFFAAAQ